MQFLMIDVLRGFASATVLVYHVIAHLNWTSFPISGPLIWFRIGWMGVDLFFVISGLVISLSAFSMLRDRESFYWTFAVHRIARIVPLYYLTCLVFLLFTRPDLLIGSDLLGNLVSHLLFVHNMSEAHAGSIDGANWSVGVEMQFYVFVLLFAPLIRKVPWWVTAGACVAIAWTWRWYAFSSTVLSGPFGPYPRFWKVTQLPGDLDEFAVGICLARVFVTDGGLKLLAFGRRFVIIPLAAATFAMSIVLEFYFRYDAAFWNSHVMVIPYRTALAMAFGFVVFAGCCLNGRLISQLMAPARYLGTISFGVYLWQLPVIFAIKQVPGLSHFEALILVLGFTALFSIGSWHLFEKPIIDRARKYLKSKKLHSAQSIL